MEKNIVLQWLDNATIWLEQAISRLSILCLVTGFIMGTVSLLAPQFQLSSLNWFSLTWAIVQAVALDTLFVGVLFLLRDTWKESTKKLRVWYLFIAVLLGIVAALINATLAYQELSLLTEKGTNPVTIMNAMEHLGINREAFVYTRSVLVVLVTALACTLPRKKIEQDDTPYKDRLLNKYRRANEKREAYLLAQQERRNIEVKYSVQEEQNAPTYVQPVKFSFFGIIKIYDTPIQQAAPQVQDTSTQDTLHKISISILHLEQSIEQKIEQKISTLVIAQPEENNLLPEQAQTKEGQRMIEPPHITLPEHTGTKVTETTTDKLPVYKSKQTTVDTSLFPNLRV